MLCPDSLCRVDVFSCIDCMKWLRFAADLSLGKMSNFSVRKSRVGETCPNKLLGIELRDHPHGVQLDLGVENYPWIKDRSNDDDVASLGRILAEFSIFDKVAAVD